MAKAAKPAAAAKKPHPADKDWRDGTAVRVRMYRHGLGDCFLLSFPRAKGHDFRVLIDCGVILGTPEGKTLIHQVVADLKAETDVDGTPTLDVLVATHEHWDHLSGFADAREAFDEFAVGRVWMAWTEDPENAEANKLRADRAAKVKALHLGAAHLKASLTAAGALGADGTGGAAAADYRRVVEVLAFFGVDPDDPPTADGLGAAAGGKKLGIADAMGWCRTHKDAEREFWNPGDLIDLGKDVKGLKVYVLGPPTDQKQLFKDLPTKAGKETYELAAAERRLASAFFGADVGQDRPERAWAEFDRAAPFDRKYRISVAEADDHDFFRAHYFGTGPDDPEAWRRIDGTGLADAAEFALNLDSDTNNTSLALAFELPDGRVLLFPGDAQVGNWESWHADSAGKKLSWKAGAKEVTAADLLARTVLYKVGHHGSHNATLRAQGLEMMTSPDLVALVPVDTYIAHEKKHWKQMPFDPLLLRLRAVAKGRVILADQPVAGLKPAAPWPGRVADAPATVAVTGDGGKAVTRPLYVEFFVPEKA